MSSSKSSIRKKINEITDGLTDEMKDKLSEKGMEEIEKHELFIDAKTVAIYWSLPNEVKTHDLIEMHFDKKNILLPAINGDNLDLKRYEGKEHLANNNKYGIAEPQGTITYSLAEVDLIIVPGVAFDVHNKRLGRGKGFYDRLLVNCKCPIIGICFPHQLVDEIPVEPHDIKMDHVIYAT